MNLPFRILNKIYPHLRKIRSAEGYRDVLDNDEKFQLHEKLEPSHDRVFCQ